MLEANYQEIKLNVTIIMKLALRSSSKIYDRISIIGNEKKIKYNALRAIVELQHAFAVNVFQIKTTKEVTK